MSFAFTVILSLLSPIVFLSGLNLVLSALYFDGDSPFEGTTLIFCSLFMVLFITLFGSFT